MARENGYTALYEYKKPGRPPKDMGRPKKKKLEEMTELERLAKKLPRLRPKSLRELDPWLRAHLHAQRLEELYAEVRELCGVTDDSFPPEGQTFYFRGDAPPQYRDPWRGRGPHLGNKGKFLVLLLGKQSTCGRYLSTFTGAKPDAPSRWYFEASDSFVFATAIDFGEGAFRSDLALHAHVTHNVVHCLLDAYKGYSYTVPVWWKEGLAHWFRRQLTEEHNNFEAIKAADKRAFTEFDWEEKVRMRAAHGLIRPLREVMVESTCQDFDLVDHMACWSRIEFLRSGFPREKLAQFLDLVKGQVDQRGNAATRDQLLDRQREALQTAFGLDPDALDERWQAWLKKPRRGK